jgi:hypothetical protein
MVIKRVHRMEACILIAKRIDGCTLRYIANKCFSFVCIVNNCIAGGSFLGASREKTCWPDREEMIVKTNPPLMGIVF